MVKKKYLLLLCALVFIPLILSFLYIGLRYQEPITICPSKTFNSHAFSDQNENGNSTVFSLNQGNGCEFIYRIEKGYIFPYAGFDISVMQPEFLDITRYNAIKLKIRSSASPSASVYIKTFEKNITNVNNSLSQRFNTKDIPLENTLKEITIPLDDFKSPNWWFQRNNILHNLPPPDYSKTLSITINTNDGTPLNVTDTINLSEMAFVHEIGSEVKSVVVALIIYGLLVSLFVIFQLIRNQGISKNNKASPETSVSQLSEPQITVEGATVELSENKLNDTPPEYTPLIVTNYSDEELRKLKEYFASNFTDSELSVQKVAEKTGISVYKVPVILKKQFGVSFKEYLNAIRLEESRRLLKNSDRQITEIAFMVGYNSPSHFNKVFKEETGMSPREYREEKDCMENVVAETVT
jgi:AraC-like DNA-binding protein